MINRFKSNILIRSFLITFFLFLFSCEKMIEVDSPNNQINREDVFKDISTTKSALAYFYYNARTKFFLNKGASGISYSLSLYTDEIDQIGTSIDNFYLNSLQASSNETASWWNNAYQSIYPINAFIEGLTASTNIDAESKKQLLGEAYTLRALHFHYLVQLFGDIPYTQSTDYNFNTTIGKTPISQVLMAIEKDLLIAIENLNNEYRGTDRIFINRAVAELLLAENYLLQNKYDQAEKFSRKVCDNSLYQIEQNLEKTFKKSAKSTLWQISPQSATQATPEAMLYIFTTILNHTTPISKSLLNSFDNADLRKQHWLKPVTINDQTFYSVYKYKNKTNNTDEYSIFFRIEQAYFVLVESLIQQNKIQQAIEVLNKIRINRGLSSLNTNLNKTELEKEFLQEVSKEFFTENGNRFFTLKRLNKLSQLNKVKPNWKNHHELFPIPEKQLQINKNLNPQNNGY